MGWALTSHDSTGSRGNRHDSPPAADTKVLVAKVLRRLVLQQIESLVQLIIYANAGLRSGRGMTFTLDHRIISVIRRVVIIRGHQNLRSDTVILQLLARGRFIFRN